MIIWVYTCSVQWFILGIHDQFPMCFKCYNYSLYVVSKTTVTCLNTGGPSGSIHRDLCGLKENCNLSQYSWAIWQYTQGFTDGSFQPRLPSDDAGVVVNYSSPGLFIDPLQLQWQIIPTLTSHVPSVQIQACGLEAHPICPPEGDGTPRLFCRMFHVSLFIVLFANNTMKGRTYYSRAVPGLESRNIIRNFQIYFKNNLILHLNKIYIYSNIVLHCIEYT